MNLKEVRDEMDWMEEQGTYPVQTTTVRVYDTHEECYYDITAVTQDDVLGYPLMELQFDSSKQLSESEVMPGPKPTKKKKS